MSNEVAFEPTHDKIATHEKKMYPQLLLPWLQEIGEHNCVSG